MIKAEDVVKAAPKYLGTPYSRMDCQAFVEKVLSDCGIKKDLRGSNTWLRFLKKNGWTGTPKECKALFGKIPKGAFLFILKQNGKEPEEYRNDGIGNASHIGIYTAMTGSEMVSIARSEGNEKAERYNFGSGAIHSSSKREAVATSNFAGRAIKDGWNLIGLWKAISYDDQTNSILNSGESSPEPGEEKMIATIYAESGSSVNFRKQPNTSAALLDQIPVGKQVEVSEKGPEWSLCEWRGKTGYIMTKFLIFGEYVPGEDADPTPIPEGMMLVNRDELRKVYDMIGSLLGERG